VFYPSEGSCGGYTHGVFSAPTRCQGVVVAGVVFLGSLRGTIAGLTDQDSLSTNLGKTVRQ